MEPKLIPIIFSLLCIVWSPLATDAAELCDDNDDCTSPDECIGGACVPPVPDPHAYVSEAMTRWSSYVWAVQYPRLFEPDPEICCFDYNGDSIPDDGLGAMLGLMGSFPGASDPIAITNTALENGELVKVFDWRELDPNLVSGDVQLSVFDGQWTDPTTHADRILGLGHTAFRRTSFGPFGAVDQLNDGNIDSGLVTVTGNHFTLLLPWLFIGDEMVSFPLLEPRLSAPVAYGASPPVRAMGLSTIDEDRGPDHVPQIVGGAKLGGMLDGPSILDTMDSFFRGCSCAGVDPDMPVINWEVNHTLQVLDIWCTSNTGNPSLCDPDDPCSNLDTVCGVISFIGQVFDADRDHDGVNESLSVGLRLGFAGTTLDHVPEIFADGFNSGTTMAWSNSVP